MIPRLEIKPHVGVGPVALGMDRQQVHDALAVYPNCGLRPEQDFAFDSSLQIEYDDNGYVQFIGVGYYNGCGADYWFMGKHIGDYSAEELFRVIADLDGDPNHQFNNIEYRFPTAMMTVWEADPQYDYLHEESRPVYGQVGLANERYFEAIRKMNEEFR